MNSFIQNIDSIVKYGLRNSEDVDNNEAILEKSLVALYSNYLSLEYEFDNSEYPEFDKSSYPNVIENVAKNFPNFGFYHNVLNIDEPDKPVENGLGDAIDDLADIIYDLLEVKWRLENNSKDDGLWFFKLIFYGHTQQHIIDLINYMKAKNG